jgi:hypothetical protein
MEMCTDPFFSELSQEGLQIVFDDTSIISIVVCALIVTGFYSQWMKQISFQFVSPSVQWLTLLCYRHGNQCFTSHRSCEDVFTFVQCSVCVCKGKAVPVRAWTGPEGSRKLRLPDFKTVAHDGGKVVSPTRCPPLPPRKYSRYSFLLEAELTPGP